MLCVRNVWRSAPAGLAVSDLVTAAVLAVFALMEPQGAGPGEVLVAVATAATLCLRTARPAVMVIAFSAGLLALSAYRLDDTPMWAFVALLVVAFSTTANLPWSRARWLVLLLLACAIVFDAASHDPDVRDVFISPAVIVGAPAAAGLLLRRSREQNKRLEQLTEDLIAQREQAREAAVLAERARIAREMHDVIAHTVGVMVVQAGAAEKGLPPGHPSIEALVSVRHTGRQALDELRRVVGVLRGAEPLSTQPQPGIADLPALVVAARELGPVELTVDDEAGQLPPGLALTIYRVVQESLTNAGRYAKGAAVSVTVTRGADLVRVVVDDLGARPNETESSSGFGLTGLRERAELYSGDLHAGPRPDGSGWRVELILPAPPRETSMRVAAS